MNRILAAILLLLSLTLSLNAAGKRLVIVAGTPSHGPGDHEFNAGSLLLQKCLKDVPGLETIVYTNGWPKNPHAFDDAAAILLYMDGGGGHPVLKDDHLQKI